MPIYEYVCSACGEEKEVIQKASEAPLEECPACYSSALRKKTSMTSFRLKGGGWYKDGYVKKNKSEENRKPETAESICHRISEEMKDMKALNNKATWPRPHDEKSMSEKSEKMDRAETFQRASRVPYIHGNDGWLADAGLLALLTEIYGAGVCDDLVSCALNRITSSEKFCVAAIAQDSNHSFLTVQTEPNEVFIFDPWVSEKRVLKAPQGEWASGRTFYFAAVGDGPVDLTDIWMNLPEAFNQGEPPILRARVQRVGDQYCESYQYEPGSALKAG